MPFFQRNEECSEEISVLHDQCTLCSGADIGIVKNIRWPKASNSVIP